MSTKSTTPGPVALDQEDIRTGITFAFEIKAAQTRLQTISEMEQAFIKRMAEKYQIDPAAYTLRDWITGFEPIPTAE